MTDRDLSGRESKIKAAASPACNRTETHPSRLPHVCRDDGPAIASSHNPIGSTIDAIRLPDSSGPRRNSLNLNTRRSHMKAVKLMAAAALVLGVSLPAWGAATATKPEAMAMVKKAVAYIKQVGSEKAYAEFDQKGSQFHDRDLYVVVYGLDGKVLAHGSKSKLIGKNLIDAQDVDGKYFVKERVALAKKEGTFWQKYKFVSPQTKKIQPKQMYCERLNETAVCGGVYDYGN
jgi:cytochrome c